MYAIFPVALFAASSGVLYAMYLGMTKVSGCAGEEAMEVGRTLQKLVRLLAL